MTSQTQVSAEDAKRIAKIKKLFNELNLSPEDAVEALKTVKVEGITIDGVHFPEETAFLFWYKRNMYITRVKEGFLVNDNAPDESFTSLNGAAAKITGLKTTNGREAFRYFIYPNTTEHHLLRSKLPKG